VDDVKCVEQAELTLAPWSCDTNPSHADSSTPDGREVGKGGALQERRGSARLGAARRGSARLGAASRGALIGIC
jgi:hypothetical protein